MKRLAALAFAIAIFAAGPAAHFRAAEAQVSADVTFASRHYVDRSQGSFNEVNPGLSVSVRGPRKGSLSAGVGVGAFYNSFGVVSFTAALRGSYSPHPWVRFGVSAGAVSGYNGVVPLAVQSVRVGPPRMQLLVFHMIGAVGFGVSFDHLLQ